MPLGLPRIPGLPQGVTRALDALADRTETQGRAGLSDGALVSVSLVAGANVVNHKLGRKPQGFIIVDVDADTRIWRSGAVDASSIPISSSAACSAKLWVF
jgi:hypothetical protein